jgi:sugar phosphate isomerase/epimerase
MAPCFRIGNQTAISAADPLEPFQFALQHGFDAFEWFADKKVDAQGKVHGWDESDMAAATRDWIRDVGRAHGITFTVHAPWQANPLHPDGIAVLLRSIAFAADIGADLVNLHLYLDRGAKGFAEALTPVIAAASQAGVRLSIENTPATTPEDFNQTFACLNGRSPPGSIGMCLDIGHANLCAVTRNDYIGYLDALAAEVPIIHAHVHENHGDADTHLTLFTGPARTNDLGVRAFLNRLRCRDYQGALILEQWPRPPTLLVEAENRLRALLANG